MSSGTILIAEDDRFLRRACDATLRARGYTTVLAEDGIQALALARATHPDLILLDLQMPGMTGLDVLQALREHDETRATRVLILSHSSAASALRGTSELGVLGYWIKATLSLVELGEGVDALMSAAPPAASSPD